MYKLILKMSFGIVAVHKRDFITWREAMLFAQGMPVGFTPVLKEDVPDGAIEVPLKEHKEEE